MNSVEALIVTHVGAGLVWLAVTLLMAMRRRLGPRMLAVQAVAAAATLAAGISLWHLLHAGGMGPVERRLVVGSVCAFVALGLQFGLIGSSGDRPLGGGTLTICWASVAFLGLAAAAMIVSRL